LLKIEAKTCELIFNHYLVMAATTLNTVRLN